MLRLILGRAGTGKTGMIMEEIRRRVAAEQGGNILIVPEQYSYEAERELLRLAGDTASLYAEVLSFTRLAHAVAREVGGSARVYTDKGGRALQMALALQRCAPELRLYGSARQRSETIRPLLSAMDELRCGCIGGDELREAAGACTGQLRQKLLDLALLQEAMAALEQQTGADPGTRLDTLADDIPRSALLRGGQIYIDGFTDFTAQERRVIRQLWLCGDVTVCLTCAGLNEEREEFASAARTALSLRREAVEDGVPVKELQVPDNGEEGPLGFLEKQLFSYTDISRDGEGRIRLITAPDAAAECELAAGEALRLVRETGCRWRDIAIAVRGFEDYRPLLESAFARAGVPLYLSHRADVLEKPLPTLILSAFAVVSGGWSYEDVFTYLKTGLTPLAPEQVDELENYVLLWDIRGGAWWGERPWRQHPEGYNKEYTGEVNERLRRIDGLRRQVAAPLRALQEGGREAKTAREQCRVTAAFWDAISLGERLDGHAGALRKLGREQEAEECLQLWDVAVEALEQCARVLGDSPMDPEEFARLFKLLLSQYDVGTIPVAVDRVTAGDFDRMRRRSLRHLLVLGATDERLPRIDGEGGVFTDSERETLRTLSLEVEDGDDRLSREFSLIYNVFTLPSESLWVSRPLFTSGGQEQRASFVSERIARLFSLSEEAGDLTEARSGSYRGALELAASGNAEARAYFEGDAEAESELERLSRAAAYRRGSLGRDGVRALYGSEPWLTASRIDTFAACKFQYFLRYGLRARPREAAGFNPPDLGTFLHHVLERCAREAGERGGFAAVSDEQVREMAGRYTEEYIHEHLEDFREKSPRFVYLFRRLQKTVEQVVLDTAGELRNSDFRPLDFELNFSGEEDLGPERLGEGESSLVLTGQVDRVDGWEKDGKLYIRVTDYKTGRREFSLSDVWYGMNLQMLLYLFALQREGERRYGKPVEPAGVLYVPARDEIIRAPAMLTDQEILAEKAKKLRRSGLLLDEEAVLRAMEKGGEGFRYLPLKLNKDKEIAGDALASAEQLGQLSGYIAELLQEMAGELRRGSIQADPWYRSSSEGACVYCSYFDACRFDETRDKPRYKTNLKAPEFWKKLEERRDKECP
ncbi:MAG: PD-(D/E)XK nuclease family protein [bacterium]|nr:PD-(D/E)XK nuclease family protein [bacterium]